MDENDWTEFVDREMLIRRVEIDDHLAEYEALVCKGTVAQSVVDDLRAKLTARVLPGDEWWEWVSGTEPLMQMGGLAIVRNGAIVWASNEWIS
jgi:hypothetical protein